MAITTIPRTPLFIPTGWALGSNATTTLNTTDDWLAFVFYWPGGDLEKCAFLCTAASGSPVVTVQLFNTDAADAGATPVNTASAIGSAVDSATLVANTITTVSAIGQAALAAGVYALRLIFKSGTSCNISRGHNAGALSSATTTQIPFVVTVADAGAQTRAVAPGGMPLALGGSVFVEVEGCVPPTAITATTSFQDTTNPDEYGLWVTSYPVTIRVCGVAWFRGTSTAPNMRVAFYSGSLASPTQDLAVTIDRDLIGNNVGSGTQYMPFSTKQTVTTPNPFGIGIRSTTTNLQNLYFWDFLTGNEVIMDMWWGQRAQLFTREADTGALTATIFRTPLIFPIIDGVDVAAAGGGLKLHPGMSGNVNG